MAEDRNRIDALRLQGYSLYEAKEMVRKMEDVEELEGIRFDLASYREDNALLRLVEYLIRDRKRRP